MKKVWLGGLAVFVTRSLDISVWWEKIWNWRLNVLNEIYSCRLFPHFTSNSCWLPYGVIFCTWRILLMVFSFTGQLKMLSQNRNQIWYKYLGSPFRTFLEYGFKLFLHNLCHRKRGRRAGYVCQLHLTDCGQKLPVVPLPQAPSLKLSLCSSALYTYWINAVFFLFNPDFLFNSDLSTSPAHNVRIGLDKQWFWFNLQSNLPAGSWVKGGRSVGLIWSKETLIIPSGGR